MHFALSGCPPKEPDDNRDHPSLPRLPNATAPHDLSNGVASYSLSPGERVRVRASVLFLLLLALLGASPIHAQDTVTNFMSPVVSYQYLDAIGAGTDTVVMSPVSSYQYFDSLGGTGVGSQQSAAVSYFYNVPSGEIGRAHV